MDDFFCAPNGSLASIKVPYLVHSPSGTETTDTGDGLTLDLLLSSSINHPRMPKSSTLAALMQSSLFFGVLERFLGDSVVRCKFSSAIEGSPGIWLAIDHSYCHRIFSTLQQNMQALSLKTREQKKAGLDQLLTEATNQSDRAEVLQCADPDEDQAVAKVALSIKILCLTLNAVAENVFLNETLPEVDFVQTPFLEKLVRYPHTYKSLSFGVLDERARWATSVLPPGWSTVHPSAKLLIDTLVENGSCRHQATGLCKRFGYSTINHLCRIRRNGERHTHHVGCSVEKCVASSSSLSQSHAHNQPGCTCGEVEVNTEEVGRLIRRGRVPLVRLRLSEGDASLEIIEMNPWSRYVAISHVWADGLGSCTTNSLLKCQIERLAEHLRPWTSIDSSVSFWMDTFCIPVASRNDSEPFRQTLKALAIARMATVYAGAQCVLILDSEMLNVSQTEEDYDYQNDSLLEARLMCSRWMTRAWTLHEAVLGRAHYVALDKGPHVLFNTSPFASITKKSWTAAPVSEADSQGSHRDLVSFRTRPGQEVAASPLFREAARHSDDFSRLLAREFDIQRRIVEDGTNIKPVTDTSLRVSQLVLAWNTLRTRATTQPEDRHAILAVLLDFNASHVLRESCQTRLPQMIRSCSELPTSLLYNNDENVLGQVAGGDSWIPTEVGDYLLVDGSYMKRGRHGFGMFFCSQNGIFPRIYEIKCASPPSSRFLRLQDRDPLSGTEYIVERLQDRASQSQIPVRQVNEREPLLQHICFIMDPTSGSRSILGFSGRGAELTVDECYDSTYFVWYSRPVVFWTSEQWHQTFNKPSPPSTTFEVDDLRTDIRLILKYGNLSKPRDDGSSIEADSDNAVLELAEEPKLTRRPAYPRIELQRPFGQLFSFLLLRMFLPLFIMIEAFMYIFKLLTEPKAPSLRLFWILSALINPIIVLAIVGSVTYTTIMVVHMFKRILWLKSFDEDWKRGPSLLDTWAILSGVALILVLSPLVVVFVCNSLHPRAF